MTVRKTVAFSKKSANLEFMSIRLRATNEELIMAKKKVKRLIEQI